MDYRFLARDYGFLTWDYGLLAWDYGLLTWDYGFLTWDYELLAWDYGFLGLFMAGLEVSWNFLFKNVETSLGTPFESGGVEMGPETVPRSRAALPARSTWY